MAEDTTGNGIDIKNVDARDDVLLSSNVTRQGDGPKQAFSPKEIGGISENNSADAYSRARHQHLTNDQQNIKVILLDPDKLFSFVKKHWSFWTISFIFQLFAITIWWLYKDRFVIAFWKLLVSAIFLEAVIITAYNIRIQHDFRKQLFAGMLVSLLSLTGLATFEANRIFNPPAFDPNDFGVAVALFGDGPEFHNTEVTRVLLCPF